ncbi:hypothetical protein [Nocardia carnea]|uniref:hypothetical protein n=1 Tax=Nocardia carnea TaxID=37328 RepID=UPI002456C008|nr:hypothetical protein [Nocardia carnea]
MLRMVAITASTIAALGLGAGAGIASAFPNGEHLVPSEFHPGTYKAVPDPDAQYSTTGYIEICSDHECDIGNGLIENMIVDGPTYFVVPDGALKVKTTDVDIYRAD